MSTVAEASGGTTAAQTTAARKEATPAPANPSPAAATATADTIGGVEIQGDEHFIPVTRYALADRLTRPQSWPPGVASQARRFFTYLDYWRQQRHVTELMHLLQAYEPFSPDSDLFVTRRFTEGERQSMQAQVISGVEKLLAQANYISIPRERIEHMILNHETHYGLDLKVDFLVFEELMVQYRGASVKKERRRKLSSFYRKQEFAVPIFRRVLVLFKIKTEERHIEDVMRVLRMTREEATRHVRKVRSHIPEQVRPENIYLKLFKNLPRSDIEMIFPNTEIKFRMQDKLWLGVSGGSAVGAGVFGAAGKLAVAFSNPVTAAGAVGGLGMVLFRQIMNVMNTKHRYMQIMAQNLYFHAMADNRGVMVKLADRAAEEDFKEEILLYSVLCKEKVNKADIRAVDEAIEHYIGRTFGLQVDFDVSDALERLLADGIVIEEPNGSLRALPPKEAAEHIDAMWDVILDKLPNYDHMAGVEVEQTQPA